MVQIKFVDDRIVNGKVADDDIMIIWRNKDGQLHRDNDKPAVIWSNGFKMWCRNGKIHRDGDKPAIIYSGGAAAYYKDGYQYNPKEK